MARVEQQRSDPMENFFKGINALQQGAENLARYNMFNKQLEEERAQAEAALELKTFQSETERLQARSYARQVLGEFGTGTPTKEALLRSGIEPETFKPVSREERKAQRDIQRAATKHEFKLEEISEEAKNKQILQYLKDTESGKRLAKQIGAKFATERVTPGRAATGRAAVKELDIKSEEVIQPFEDLINVPGIFKKKVVAVELIEKFGTEKVNKMLPFINKVNEKLKESPGQKKEILKRLMDIFPELEEFLK